MRRLVPALLVATTCGSALFLPVARADRPKDQQDDAGVPPPPPPPPPATTTAPLPPPPPTAPTIIVAPTVAATGNVIVAPPPAPTGGSVVITPQGVPVMIRNAAPEPVEHRLVTIDGTVLGSCMGNCTFQVPPGTYVLESGETDELRAGRQKIVVTGPTMVDVKPGNKGKRTTGLALGIAGPVLVFVGLVGTMVVAIQREDIDFDCRVSGDRCNETKPSYTPWVLSMVGGAAATTWGWIMFASNGTKIRTSGYAPASVALAPIVTPKVTGAALTVVF